MECVRTCPRARSVCGTMIKIRATQAQMLERITGLRLVEFNLLGIQANIDGSFMREGEALLAAGAEFGGLGGSSSDDEGASLGLSLGGFGG